MSFKLVGEKTTLGVMLMYILMNQMYRDCLRTVKYMTQDVIVIITIINIIFQPRSRANISLNFRREFEKQRAVTDKDQHQKFRDGITRLLSNYMLYDITR